MMTTLQTNQHASENTATPNSQQSTENTATITFPNASVGSTITTIDLDTVRKLAEEYNSSGNWQDLKKGLLLVLDKKSKAYEQLSNRCWSPHSVGYYGHLELATVLLEAGLDVNNADEYGHTMLHGSAESGNIILAQTILDHRAFVDLPDKSGTTALLYSSCGDNLDMVMFLVERKSNVNCCDKLGYTSLHYAAQYGRYEIVRYLVQAGANTAARDKHDKQTPQDIAKMRKHNKVKNFLSQFPR